MPSVEAELLIDRYSLTAILNFAATGLQGTDRTCSRCFFKSHDLPYHHAKFQKGVTVHDSDIFLHSYGERYHVGNDVWPQTTRRAT